MDNPVEYVSGSVGKEVHYFDPKSKEVRKGTVSGLNISTTGYILVNIIGKNVKQQLEVAHVHTERSDAEAHRNSVIPYIKEADKIMADAKRKIDALRIHVIGEPEYPALARDLQK